MPKFCENCNNLLNPITTSVEYYTKCTNCLTTYPVDPEDTMLFEDVKGTKFNVYKKLIDSAHKDPCNPKIKLSCECGSEYHKQIRVGDDMKLIVVCMGCKKINLYEAIIMNDT